MRATITRSTVPCGGPGTINRHCGVLANRFQEAIPRSRWPDSAYNYRRLANEPVQQLTISRCESSSWRRPLRRLAAS